MPNTTSIEIVVSGDNLLVTFERNYEDGIIDSFEVHIDRKDPDESILYLSKIMLLDQMICSINTLSQLCEVKTVKP